MNLLRWIGVFLLGLILGCGPKPPVDEIAAATAALQSARDERAQTYAAEQFRTAEKTLTQARNELIDEEYGLALKLAQLSLLQAQYAAAVSQWRLKSDELNQAKTELQASKDEIEQLKFRIDEVKKQIQ